MIYAVILVIRFGMGVFISNKIGVKRTIGVNWSMFFCILFGFIIGYIITISTPKAVTKKYYNKAKQFNAVWFSISVFVAVVCGFGFFMEITRSSSFYASDEVGRIVFPAIIMIGAIGGAIYNSAYKWGEEEVYIPTEKEVQQVSILIEQKEEADKKEEEIISMPRLEKSDKQEVKFVRKPKTKRWKIAVGIALFFVITNPSKTAFNEHTDSKHGTKKINFLVCSIYEKGDNLYLGVLMNFIPLTY